MKAHSITGSAMMTSNVKRIWFRALLVAGTLLSIAVALGAERRWN